MYYILFRNFPKDKKNYIDFSFTFFSLIYIEKLLAWVKLKSKTKKNKLRLKHCLWIVWTGTAFWIKDHLQQVNHVFSH